jgi:dCMP deaminase
MARAEWPIIFMKICETIRDRSSCLKYKTSCLVVKGTQIISIGYNGTASKQTECDDYWRKYWEDEKIKEEYHDWIKSKEFKDLHSKWSVINEIHAEVNALNWISKHDVTDDYVLYTYYSPCEQCAKQIVSYGIKTVYYLHDYKGRVHGCLQGIDYLKNMNINCIKIQYKQQ